MKEKINDAVKDAVQWTIQIGAKKKGEWRTPVKIKLHIDPEFLETYNPKLPRWSDADFFEGTIFQEDCGRISCSTCRKDLFERLGFVPYQYGDVKETSCQLPCFIFFKRGDSYFAEFFFDWEENNKYDKEIETLINLMESLEREVVKFLFQSYQSNEPYKIVISKSK